MRKYIYVIVAIAVFGLLAAGTRTVTRAEFDDLGRRVKLCEADIMALKAAVQPSESKQAPNQASEVNQAWSGEWRTILHLEGPFERSISAGRQMNFAHPWRVRVATRGTGAFWVEAHKEPMPQAPPQIARFFNDIWHQKAKAWRDEAVDLVSIEGSDEQCSAIMAAGSWYLRWDHNRPDVRSDRGVMNFIIEEEAP